MTSPRADVELANADRPSLHLPEEPLDRGAHWRDLVFRGAQWDELVVSEEGPAGWLWQRWRALQGAGLAERAFFAIVSGYRRELWLWLVGERTWRQACSGLIGRLERRLAPDAQPGWWASLGERSAARAS